MSRTNVRWHRSRPLTSTLPLRTLPLNSGLDLSDFLESPKYNYSDPLSAEFGVYTRAQLAAFVARNLPEFSLVIPLNELTDGLLIMKQILNWELVDLTYIKVLDSSSSTLKRWDGKAVQPTPRVKDVPLKIVDAIKAKTQLDSVLFEASLRISTPSRIR